MAEYLGDYPVNGTVQHKWGTQGASGASITRAVDGALRFYKNASATERASAAGITDTEDFDTLVGVHHITVDLSNNADAGFWAAGNEYQCVLAAATIDGQAINACLFAFSIERVGGVLALLKAAGLATTRLDANIMALGGNLAAATALRQSQATLHVGTVTGAATPTTLIDTTLTQADVDHWKGRVLIFVTGGLAQQATRIIGFDPSTDRLTFNSLTGTPGGGDAYVIV